MSGSACIWCGLHEIDDGTTDTVFACGSSRRLFSDICFQSAGCEEILQLRKRIADAIELARQADRFDVIEWDGGTAVVREDDKPYAWATSLDEIAAILEGEQ